MISRILISLCSVAASVGLLLVGMATSYAEKDNGMLRLGVVLMIIGVAGTVVGAIWYRAEEAAATAKLEAQRVRISDR